MANEKSQHPSETTSENDNVSTTMPPAILNENRPTQAHNRSHAAHLDSGGSEPHTKPARALRQGVYATSRKQP